MADPGAAGAISRGGAEAAKRGRSLRTELKLVPEAELANLLKVCSRQLYNWRISGHIPYLKIGRAVRFRAREVLRALEAIRGA